MRDDDDGIVDHRYCTLVDRAALGGVEYMFGGRVYQFKPGQVELIVPQSVARHLCDPGKTQAQVWTMDNERVCRLAVRGGSPDLLAVLGEGADDETPIEIDPTVSNINGERFEPAVMAQATRAMRREQREQQGGAATRVAAGTGA